MLWQEPPVRWSHGRGEPHQVDHFEGAANGEAARLAVEVTAMKAARLDPDDYRTALRRFTEVYDNLDPVQEGDLLAYLLDRVDVRAVMEEGKVVATAITIALSGETPDVAR